MSLLGKAALDGCVLVAAMSLGVIVTATSAIAKDSEKAIYLEPSSKWNLHFADDSCRLSRIFGEGKDKTAFYIERFEPGDSFMMLAAGAPLKGSRTNDRAFVQFGAQEKEIHQKEVALGNLVDYEPALIFTALRFDQADYDDGADETASPNVFGQSISPEQEEAISWIRIRRKGQKPVYLETGSLGEPMRAMRKCTDELLTNWGIDLDKHKDLASLPEPKKSPDRWLNSRDYPTDLLRKGNQGLVNFRLSIDANGMPTACHIQKSTRPEGFDKAVCDGLMRKATFEPARTSNGEAIASYWRNTVRFVIPR